jgi:hypothetical protein
MFNTPYFFLLVEATKAMVGSVALATHPLLLFSLHFLRVGWKSSQRPPQLLASQGGCKAADGKRPPAITSLTIPIKPRQPPSAHWQCTLGSSKARLHDTVIQS